MFILLKLIKVINCVILLNFKILELVRNEVINLRENIIDFRVIIKIWMSVICLFVFFLYFGLILNRFLFIFLLFLFFEEELNRVGFFCRFFW